MDLQEATATMALLMKNEAEYYKENLENVNPVTPEESERYQKKLNEFKWIKSNTLEFGNRLAANPCFFDIMESWHVVLYGKEGVNKNSVYEAYKTHNVEDLIDRCGGIAINIKEYIKTNGYLISDMSAGEDGWDISVKCTEKKSRDLCGAIYRRYSHTINLKLLSISRRFAGHCLPGLYDWNDAYKYLKMYGLK